MCKSTNQSTKTVPPSNNLKNLKSEAFDTADTEITAYTSIVKQENDKYRLLKSDLPERCSGFPSIAPKPQNTLRFITINSDGGFRDLRWRNLKSKNNLVVQKEHLDCLGRLIVAMDADVVYFSELHSKNRYWPKFNMLKEIKRVAQKYSANWISTFVQNCRIPNNNNPDNIAPAGDGLLVRDREITGNKPVLLARDYDGVPENGKELSMRVELPVENLKRNGRIDHNAICFTDKNSYIRGRGRQKSALLAVVHGIEVAGVHLSPGRKNADQRIRQIEHLARKISNFRQVSTGSFENPVTQPTIVMGDFNEGDSIFSDVSKIKGLSTWQNSTGHIKYHKKIDHIFVNGLEVVAAKTLHMPQLLNHHVMYVDVKIPR